MSYLSPALGQTVRACGRGGAMGDVSPAPDTVSALVAQVNRFDAKAPSGYQFVTEPFTAPPSFFGVALLPISVALATMALVIYQRRATDAYNQFHDAGSQQAIAAANAGFADPPGFVTDHLTDVTQTLQAFADSLGIAPPPGDTPTNGGGSSGTLLLVAGVLAAWWWMEPKRK